jgi:cardiolipin synthase
MNGWIREQIFQSGDLYFAKLERDIESAKKSIDLETYIFHLDPLGRRILQQLKAAAERGITVRVLVDGVGTLGYAQDLIQELNENQAQAKIYHPLPWKLNRRNHRKVCVVDRSIAFLGGMNISACHLKCYSGKNAWRDTGVRVVGKGVLILTAAFEKCWDYRTLTHPIRRPRIKNLSSHRLIKLNDTWRRRRNYQQEILRRVNRAKNRVWITTTYFVPEFLLIRALRKTASRSIDVRILLPRKNDLWFMKWINQAFYSLLLSSGIRIFEYLPTTLHAKIMIVDDWMTVGSSNRNYRSWLHDLEVDLVITHSRSKSDLCSQFIRDLEAAQEIELMHWKKRSWLRAIGERVALFIKYWL